MKFSRKLLFLGLLLLVGIFPAQAQQKLALSASSTDCSTAGSCLSIGLTETIQGSAIQQRYGGVSIAVGPNASSNTLQFEASGDGGTTWVALNATPSNSTTAATSTTSTGVWQANVAGYTNVRVRVSTLAGGTATVSITPSIASARSGGGGGGGSGTVSSCATSNAVGIFGTGPSTTIGCGNADLTYLSHTFTLGSGGTLNLGAASATGGFKLPLAAGAAPIADGWIAVNSTNHSLVYGSNGSTVTVGGGTISGLTAGYIPKAGGATSITANSACDDSITTAATVTCTEPIVATAVTAGSGASAAGATATGGIASAESTNTGWTPTAGQDYIRADSTLHKWICSLNNGSEVPCAGPFTDFIPLENCTPGITTNPGNSFWNVTGLTSWDSGHWEFVKNTAADLWCTVRVPHTLSGTTGSIVLDMAANDGTAGHTDAINTADVILAAATSISNPTFAAVASQNYTTTATAYTRQTLTFAVQATLAADGILLVQIHQAASNSVTNNLFIFGAYLSISRTQ